MANIPNHPPFPTNWKQSKNNLNPKENISLSEGLNAITTYFKQKSGTYIITSRTQRNRNDLEALLTKNIESEKDIMKKWIKTHYDWFRSCEEFKDIAIDNIPPPT